VSDPSTRLDLWGGVECTVNRVENEYFDQMNRSGRLTRPFDLDRFADLGISALRQPVLWELVAPESISKADWSWPDRQLARLRELNVRPIVGLVHHGSGPRHTSLIDPEFPEKFAEYARAVAKRYPWVEDFTPINEPLTTARFSGLYGFWYPHGSDELTFATALLNECRATVLAMRAIRGGTPQARLVQTDDLGKAFSTPALRYQADFENERRWGAWDLLCGRLTPDSVLWRRFENIGVAREKLEWFLDNPCPPDVIGVNHYLSGERYLDENLERYPGEPVGGNGRDRYVDVLAARVRAEGASGFYEILREAWDRYRLPIAITEVHNGCTREEQVRWLVEAWQAAQKLRDEGADIRAVTAWSLLGAFDWDSLVTRNSGNYEPGVFDIRSPEPRETAIAKIARQLASEGDADHPILDSPGWWQRSQRFVYGHAITDDGQILHPRNTHGLRIASNARPLVITGAGTLGHALERACVLRGLEHVLLTRSELDIADHASVRRLLRELQPWAVINAAGFVRVDEAEDATEQCMRENLTGAVALAETCAELGAQFVTFSSDLVFDGSKGKPYLESDSPSPLNVYGLSKAFAEEQVLAACSSAMVVRTSAFFGPWDRINFVYSVLRSAFEDVPFMAAEDAVVSPTYVPDLVNTTLDLLVDGERGIWHLANAGQCSWAELASMVLERGGYSQSILQAVPTRRLGLRAARPLRSVLGSERSSIMPSLDSGLDRYFRDCKLIQEFEDRLGEAAA
jgi:dTDP-4-dehydrorhamnose reductase